MLPTTINRIFSAAAGRSGMIHVRFVSTRLWKGHEVGSVTLQRCSRRYFSNSVPVANSSGGASNAGPSSGAGGSLSVNKGPVSWPSLVLLLLTGGALVGYYNYEKERKKTSSATTVTTIGRAALGGPWCLVDTNGQVVSDRDFRGQYMLVYFGFTFCPDICPSELQKMSRVITKLEQSNPTFPKVTPVFISLDPHRDTITQMRAYAQDFHPRMQSLTGTPNQCQDIARKFRVYYSHVDRKEDSDEDYMVDHSIVMYLMDRNGEFMEFFTQLAEVDEIVTRMTAIIKKDLKGGNRLMAQEGPIVKAVKLAVDGSVEELTVDMTPSLNALGKILGGSVGLAGQLPGIGVVAVARRDCIIEDDEEEAPSQLKKSAAKVKTASKGSKVLSRLGKKEDEDVGTIRNAHTLPPPLTDLKVNGHIVLVRMNEESEPEPFTRVEYEAYVAEPVLLSSDSEGEEEGEDDDDDDDDDDEEEEDDDDDDDDDDDEEDEEEEEEEEVKPVVTPAQSKKRKADSTTTTTPTATASAGSEGAGEFALVEIVREFKKSKRREPTPDEMMALLSSHYGVEAAEDDDGEEAVIDGDGEFDEDDEEDEEDEDDEEDDVPVQKPTTGKAGKGKQQQQSQQSPVKAAVVGKGKKLGFKQAQQAAKEKAAKLAASQATVPISTKQSKAGKGGNKPKAVKKK